MNLEERAQGWDSGDLGLLSSLPPCYLECDHVLLHSRQIFQANLRLLISLGAEDLNTIRRHFPGFLSFIAASEALQELWDEDWSLCVCKMMSSDLYCSSLRVIIRSCVAICWCPTLSVPGDTDHSLRSVAVKRGTNVSDPGWALVRCNQGLQ